MSFLMLLLVSCSLLQVGHAMTFPSSINLRAGVLHAPPFAMVEETGLGQAVYNGYQIDLLQRMQVFAKQDNVDLTFDVSRSPPQYAKALDLVANDCKTTADDVADCGRFDLIIGDYYVNPDRSLRVDFTPSWLRTTMTTIKFLEKPEVSKDFTTLTEADKAGATVCVPDGTYLMSVVMDKFQNAEYLKCPDQQTCIEELKNENCVLYCDDELQLRYRAVLDPSLEVTREQFNTQYLVWPMRFDLDQTVSLLFKRWIYAAVANATLDELYFTYFEKEGCPVGTAGENCELPCDPNHGTSDDRGVCVCESSRWEGDDCSIEVEEDLNLIPPALLKLGTVMFCVNAGACVLCAIWLMVKWNTPQVKVAQPTFLALVLVGCIISSSTIIPMGVENDGEGSDIACMAIPWLYSVGFSITFGTLFAKIRRVYIMFKNAARLERKSVTSGETFGIVCVVLVVDILILAAWTLVDPLQWERTILRADVFGHPLESEGSCTSDHWEIFGSIIAALHLALICIACYMCYVARDIPTQFSEGKYLAMAMVSNLQIYIVGIPVLILVSNDADTSFFVRSAIVWMNDFVVLVLIFGNLIKSVHQGATEAEATQTKMEAAASQAVMKLSTVSQAGRGSKRTTKTSKRTGTSPSQLESVAEASDESNPDRSSRQSEQSGGRLGFLSRISTNSQGPERPKKNKKAPTVKESRKQLSSKLDQLKADFRSKDKAALGRTCSEYESQVEQSDDSDTEYEDLPSGRRPNPVSWSDLNISKASKRASDVSVSERDGQ